MPNVLFVYRHTQFIKQANVYLLISKLSADGTYLSNLKMLVVLTLESRKGDNRIAMHIESISYIQGEEVQL